MVSGISQPERAPAQAAFPAEAPAPGRPQVGDGTGRFRTLLDHALAMGRLEEAKKAADGGSLEGLEEAAAAFEALFLQHMIQTMRKTVPKGGLIELGFAGETYMSMLDQALAEEMAKAGGIGLGRLLIDQLS